MHQTEDQPSKDRSTPILVKEEQNLFEYRIRKRKWYGSSFHDDWDNSSGDLDSCEVNLRASDIEGAGLGLFATKHMKAGKRVCIHVTKYSGKKIGRATALCTLLQKLVHITDCRNTQSALPGCGGSRYNRITAAQIVSQVWGVSDLNLQGNIFHVYFLIWKRWYPSL